VKRAIAMLGCAALAAALAGCGERAQTATPASKKSDAKPWEGGVPAYATGNWKAGDQNAWEEQMRVRAQGQNEYSRSASTTSQP